MKTGRPTKQTDDNKKKLLAALRGGNTRRAAAASVGMSEDTFSRMMKDPQFADAVAQAEAGAEKKLVSIIQKAATPHEVKIEKVKETAEGVLIETTTKREFNWNAAAWLLERRWPKDWRQSKSISVEDLSNERLLELLDGLEDEEEEAQGASGEGSPE